MIPKQEAFKCVSERKEEDTQVDEVFYEVFGAE